MEVMGREVIKPASPAPKDHLQLSLLDLCVPAEYVSTIFFYKTLPGDSSSEFVCGRLKSSLSKTLSRFYPLAGRIEGLSVKCNGEGAVFVEARTDLPLSDFLKNNLVHNVCSLSELFPQLAPEESAGTWPLLIVKVTCFGSGSGVAVSLAISHKICDLTSALTFALGWATDAKGGEPNDDMAVAAPQFAGDTIFPTPPSFSTPRDALFDPNGTCVTNRFLFKSSSISQLKRKAATQSVPLPTRVEAITSLIWRCARNASNSVSGARKSTRMYLAMDLRLRFPSHVLSPSAIGNVLSSFSLEQDAHSEMQIGQTVADFRKAKDLTNKTIEQSLDDTAKLGIDLLSVLATFSAESKSDVELFAMTSWCRKPFYQVDFGWGSPLWVGTTSRTNIASLMLIDSKNGEDVEAWVVLPEQDMTLFIRDQDMLTYAILNPPILI